MIPIPQDLLEQIARGNVLLFLGERLAQDREGRPLIDQLAVMLASRTRSAPASSSFPEAAQVFEDEHGRNALIRSLRDFVKELGGDEPQRVHRLLAGLDTCRVLVTTSFDRRLERAFAEAGRSLDVVLENLDVALADERSVQLYKLRGTIERPGSLVLTEDQVETFFDDQTGISVQLQAYLASMTVLFMGYDLADPHFKRLYRKVTGRLDDYARQAYAFGEAFSPATSNWSRRHGIQVVTADSSSFLESLLEQLSSRTQGAGPASLTPSARPDTTLPERPYKLLDFYEARDAANFFGRRRETQDLTAMIHAHRLVLLYGPSGVGKTSLLLAGVAPRLDQAELPYKTLYVRAFGDPDQAIRRDVALLDPEAALPDGPLVEFLAAATRALDKSLVIFLDQFEEFFIRLSPQVRSAFVEQLGALFDARQVPVKIVLSLREDWLASVSEIEARIPEVFRNRIRLLPLTADQAREAITAPVAALGIRYEPALVDRLLQDLPGSDGDVVMPPQLQLVCSALYRRLPVGEKTISLAGYQSLGGARGILQRYLDEELALLGAEEQLLARAILEELVTSQGTKAVKTAAELALGMDLPEEQLSLVLEKLVRARLLRALERGADGKAFELAHEYLIGDIGTDRDAQQRKAAQELLRQELDNWERFGTLLASDKLGLFAGPGDDLRLSSDAQELLLRSAVLSGHQVAYWAGRATDETRRLAVLADLAARPSAAVRQRVASVLGLRDLPTAVSLLVQLAVHDPDATVRATAQESLAGLEGQRGAAVAQLQAEAAGADRSIRRRALETLAVLPLSGLPAGLKVRVLLTRLRLGLGRLAHGLVATPQRRAVAMAMALLTLLVGTVYAISANSYYVDISSSRLILRRGHPKLLLPGLDQVEVDTGVDAGTNYENLASSEAWEQIEAQKSLTGFWFQRTDQGYQQWAQDLADVLKPDQRLRVLWDLSRPQAALAMAGLPAASEQAAADYLAEDRAQAVGQVLAAGYYDEVGENLDQLTPGLIDGMDSGLTMGPASAAYALAQASGLQTGLATPVVVDRLLAGLDRSYGSERDRLLHGIERALAANPGLATEALAYALLQELDKKPVSTFLLGSEYQYYMEGDRLRYSLAGLAAADPDMARYLVARLSALGTASDDDNVRPNALRALGTVILASPVMTEAAVADMSLLLTHALETGSGDVPAAATLSLAEVAKARPEAVAGAVSQATLTALLDRLRSADPDRALAYAYVIQQLMAARPDLVSQPLVDRLLDAIGPNQDGGYAAATYELRLLSQVLSSNPQLIPPEMAGVLLDRMARATGGSPSYGMPLSVVSAGAEAAATLLGRWVAENPESGEQVLGELFQMVTAEDQDVQALGIFGLGQLAAWYPPAATGENVQILLDQLDGRWRREVVVSALGQMIATRPELATPDLALGMLPVSDYWSPFDLVEIPLALMRLDGAGVDVRQQLDAAARQLLAKLADSTDASVRADAAWYLFELALRLEAPCRENPLCRETFVEPLEQMAAGPEPAGRMAANQALQMLDVAALAQIAAREPARWDELVGALHADAYLDFLGDAFTLAARRALVWLGQQALAKPRAGG